MSLSERELQTVSERRLERSVWRWVRVGDVCEFTVHLE